MKILLNVSYYFIVKSRETLFTIHDDANAIK